MEDVISHFKNNVYIQTQEKGYSVGLVESPKGIMSVTLVTGGRLIPYRVQVKSPVAANLNVISSIANKVTLADFVATFCSLDVVLGEIDR
jgi:NADH:ubiquinone oxidoreductase subunit D